MSIYYAFKKLGCHENYLIKFKSVNMHWKKKMHGAKGTTGAS